MELLRASCCTRIIPLKLPFTYEPILQHGDIWKDLNSIENRVNRLHRVLGMASILCKQRANSLSNSIFHLGKGSSVVKHSGKFSIIGAILAMASYFLKQSTSEKGTNSYLYLGIAIGLGTFGVSLEFIVQYFRARTEECITENTTIWNGANEKLEEAQSILEIINSTKQLFHEDGKLKPNGSELVDSLKSLYVMLIQKNSHQVPNSLALGVGELKRLLETPEVKAKRLPSKENAESEEEMLSFSAPSKQAFSNDELLQIQSMIKVKIITESCCLINELSKWVSQNIPKDILEGTKTQNEDV